MIKDFEEFSEVINQLDVEDSPIITPSPLLWKFFLQYLNEEPGHFFYDDDFSDNLFSYIQQQIDLQDYDLEELKDKDFWNESVQELINKFLNYYDDSIIEQTIEENDWAEIINGKIPLGDGYFNTEDIKYADAGNSFNAIASNNVNLSVPIWVRPWYNTNPLDNSLDTYNEIIQNIQGNEEDELFNHLSTYEDFVDYLSENPNYYESYYKVRSEDLNLEAISNSTNLTFTREQSDQPKWLRLLMPKNSRRVEVEDLNRNFWVLSSVLSGICGHLFDPNSPVSSLLKDSINEIIQLWENIIYLWGTVATYNQSLITDTRIEVVPIFNNSCQPYKKYDNFNIDNITEEQILDQINPIIQKYNTCNLCIIPFIRTSNYYKNYYNLETYLGIIFYNATTKDITYHPITTRGGSYVCFDPSIYGNFLYGIRENDRNYSYLFPASNAGNYTDADGKHRYYAALRVIPQLSFSVNENGKLVVKNFNLLGYDPAREAILGDEGIKLICSYTQDSEQTEWTEDSENNFYVTYTAISGQQENGFDIRTYSLQGQAFYLGELPSFSYASNEQIVYEIDEENKLIGDGVLIKIGNFLPYNTSVMSENAWRAQIGESVSSSNQKTGYELNFTLKGDSYTQNSISGLYGGLGAGNVPIPSKCTFFIPKWDSTEEKFVYQSDSSINYTQVTLNNLKTIGTNVLKDYIPHSYAQDDSSIVYFITAIGTIPWHNTTANIGNGVFQGYWKNALLCHLFRYIPYACEKYRNKEATYITIESKGYLEYLGEINKIEKAIGTNYFKSNNGTTWRLPKLYGETKIADYLSVKCTQGSIVYYQYVDLNQHQDMITMTNPQKIAYIQNNPTILIGYEQIGAELENPSGVWAVYDGNVSNQTNNKVYNATSPPYRQVFEAQFNNQNGLSQLKDKLGRKIGDNGALNSHDGNVDLWPASIFTDENQHFSSNSWYSAE